MENEKKVKFNIAGLIFACVFIAIAVVLIVVGVSRLVEAGNINVPSMGESGWFDMSVKQSEMESGGIAFIFFGIFLFIIGIVVLIVSRVAKRGPLFIQNSYKKIVDNMKDMSDYVKEKFNYNGDSKTKSAKVQVNCEYCGSILENNITKCPHCGAVRKK